MSSITHARRVESFAKGIVRSVDFTGAGRAKNHERASDSQSEDATTRDMTRALFDMQATALKFLKSVR